MLYDKGIQSQKDTLEDVLDVFNYLRNGSYNHYWVFNKGLKIIKNKN